MTTSSVPVGCSWHGASVCSLQGQSPQGLRGRTVHCQVLNTFEMFESKAGRMPFNELSL